MAQSGLSNRRRDESLTADRVSQSSVASMVFRGRLYLWEGEADSYMLDLLFLALLLRLATAANWCYPDNNKRESQLGRM